jgi:hypothetical protein
MGEISSTTSWPAITTSSTRSRVRRDADRGDRQGEPVAHLVPRRLVADHGKPRFRSSSIFLAAALCGALTSWQVMSSSSLD